MAPNMRSRSGRFPVSAGRGVALMIGALALAGACSALATGAATKQPQVLTFISTPASPAFVGEVYTVEVLGADTGQTITMTNGGVHCTIADVTDTEVFTSQPPNPAVVGNTYTPTATDGAQAEVTFTHPGTCDIRATQLSDASFATGTASQVITVVKAP